MSECKCIPVPSAGYEGPPDPPSQQLKTNILNITVYLSDTELFKQLVDVLRNTVERTTDEDLRQYILDEIDRIVREAREG